MKAPRMIAAIAVLALISLTGCSAFNNAAATLETPTEGPTFTGPPGSLKSPEQQATEAALVAVDEYYAVLADVVKPNADINKLDTVAAGTYLDSTKHILEKDVVDIPNAGGKVIKSTVTTHDIPKDETGTPIPGIATIELNVCLALPDGTQQLGRPILTNTTWPNPSGWKVTSDYTLPDTPCTGISY